MTTRPKKTPNSATSRESQHDQRTELVKGIVARENAELDARTARLAALRLFLVGVALVAILIVKPNGFVREYRLTSPTKERS